MKKVLLAAVVAALAAPAYAQCPSGGCPLVRPYSIGTVQAVPMKACEPTKVDVKPCAPVEFRPVTAGLLEIANRVRARFGRVVLTYDENLDEGAERQANYCAQTGRLVHEPGVIEILAYNSQGLEAALNQWLASPAHRQILLNGRYRYAGVAVVRDRYGRSWCAMRFR